jgi:ABC-type amino acid transport substrate-binding protein
MIFAKITIVLTASLFALIGCERNAITAADNAYNNTLETGVLRAGYVTYPPSFIVDPNSGELSGISHDILQLAANNLDLELNFVEEVAWGSMIEAVDARRVDIIGTGIWPTAARGKRADFVTPIFYSPVIAYVRADDTRYDGNLAIANNAKTRIAVLDGEMAATIANSDYPNAKQVSLTQVSQVSQLLLEVVSNKADITFVEPAIALAYMNKNPNSLKAVEGVPAIRAFPTAYLISKNSPKLKSMMDVAILELIRNGDVDRILAQYEDYEGSFIRVPIIQ